MKSFHQAVGFRIQSASVQSQFRKLIADQLAEWSVLDAAS